jgi:predicted DNA-binding transcriptional regulator YafY
LEKSANSFVVDPEFDVLGFLDANLFIENSVARVRLRLGKGHSLRIGATILTSDGDFDLCEIPYRNEEHFIDQILWHGEDAIVDSPPSLRENVIHKLTNLAKSHE